MTTGPLHLRRVLVAASVLSLLALAGCGSDDDSGTTPPTASQSPTSSAPPKATRSPEPTQPTEPAAAATVEVRISGADVTPVAQAVSIGVGETVALRIDSDRAGELHVHAVPEQTRTFEAGRSTVKVRLDRPGTVDIEEHESGVLLLRVLVK